MKNNEDFIFKVENFSGPLNVLLDLFKTNKMEIVKTNIETIIDQYLEYVDSINTIRYDNAVEYIEFAVELIYFKSMLLTEDKQDYEEEEENIDLLIEKILEYKSYKEASSQMENLKINRSKLLTTNAMDLGEYKLKEKIKLIEKSEFLDMANTVIPKIILNEESLHNKIEITSENSIKAEVDKLKNQKEIYLYQMMSSIHLNSKKKIIVFLAFLEILKDQKFEMVKTSDDLVIRPINDDSLL